MLPPDSSISIIVPCWRDAGAALEAAKGWSGHAGVSDIILAGVVDAAPGTDVSAIAKVKWCASPRPSRGEQMNLGASLATAGTLLFHHVDSELTAGHIDALALAMHDPGTIGGGFYRKFDNRHSSLRWLEYFERVHNRAFGTIYGDQSLFVRREIFLQLGGFARIPLMEDVEFSRRLRGAGKTALLDPPMRSSPVRQIEQGPWRVTLRNLSFLIAFRCGISPEQLHRHYYGARSMQPRPGNSRIPREMPVAE